MKKLIILLTISSLFFGCSNNGTSNNANNNNNNNNSFTNSVDYEFTITINGQVNKIKGNTTGGIPFPTGSHQVNNTCYAHSDNSYVLLQINDVTAPNFVSGQNLKCQIDFSNLLLGINQAQVSFFGGYVQTLATSLGAINFYYQTTSGADNNLNQHILPINITDLGNTSTNYTGPQYNFGQTIKGNYSGTIYLSNTTNGQFTIPVQLSIDFKALRMY